MYQQPVQNILGSPAIHIHSLLLSLRSLSANEHEQVRMVLVQWQDVELLFPQGRDSREYQTNFLFNSSFNFKPLATASYVTSSCVGPTPPDVNTTEYFFRKLRAQSLQFHPPNTKGYMMHSENSDIQVEGIMHITKSKSLSINIFCKFQY